MMPSIKVGDELYTHPASGKPRLHTVVQVITNNDTTVVIADTGRFSMSIKMSDIEYVDGAWHESR